MIFDVKIQVNCRYYARVGKKSLKRLRGIGKQKISNIKAPTVTNLRGIPTSVKSSKGPECPVCEYINNNSNAKKPKPIITNKPALI